MAGEGVDSPLRRRARRDKRREANEEREKIKTGERGGVSLEGKTPVIFGMDRLADFKGAEGKAQIPGIAGRADHAADFHRHSHFRFSDDGIGQCEC